MKLTSKQRKYLKSQAHHLKPVLLIGKNTLDSSLIKSVDELLNHHELIKIKFNHHKSEKENFITEINNSINSETVGMIGNIAILYRQIEEVENRRYHID